MGIVLYLIFLFAVMVLSFRYFIPEDDRRYVFKLIMVCLPIQIVFLYLLNSIVPFVPIEIDTYLYYIISQRQFESAYDYINLQATAEFTEGWWDGIYLGKSWGGIYLHLLTIIHQFVGDSLFFCKLLNLTSFWPLVFAWYCIGRLFRGKTFARYSATAIAWLPTLWYPFIVLHRDLLTSMLHSIFFASLLQYFYNTTRRRTHVTVATFSVILLFALRQETIYINFVILLAVLAGIFIKELRETIGFKHLTKIFLAGAAIVLILAWFTTRPYSAISLRSLEQTKGLLSLFLEGSEVGAESFGIRRIVSFLPLLLASEPTVASKYLDFFDPEQIRGIMNGPWFTFGVPFSILGLYMMVRLIFFVRPIRRQLTQSAEEIGYRWGVIYGLLGYCVVWWIVCAISWDWTRWRLPVVPALVTVAVWSFTRLRCIERTSVLLGWIAVLVVWRIFL